MNNPRSLNTQSSPGSPGSPSIIFEALITELKREIKGFFLDTEKVAVEARWRMGDILVKYENKHQLNYSEAVMTTIASKIDIHFTELYLMRRLRNQFGSLIALRERMDSIQYMGKRPSWNYFCVYVLPDQATAPHAFGGKDASFRQLLDRGERYAHKTAEMATKILHQLNDITDQSLRDEAAGALGEMAASMSQSIAVSTKAELTMLKLNLLSVSAESAEIESADLERSEKYLAFVRSLPCCACGIDKKVKAHHATKIESGGGWAKKGSDFEAIPLCNDHHQAVHILGTLAFEAKYQLTINRLIIQTLKQWVIKTLKPF